MSEALIIEQLELHIAELDALMVATRVERDRASAALVALRGEVAAVLPSSPAATKPAPVKKTVAKAAAGRTSKYDWEEIARVCRSAHAVSMSMNAAVAEALGVNATTANWLVTQARKRGFDVPTARTGARPATAKRNGVSARVVGPAHRPQTTNDGARNVTISLAPPTSVIIVEDDSADESPSVPCPSLGDVAKLYLEAEEAGQKPIQVLAERFEVDRAHAQDWVTACRSHGFLPSRDEPQRDDRVADAPRRARWTS